MFKNDHIPVLTDLIEKGTDIKLTDLELNHSEDLILEANDREEPHIDVTQLYFEAETETRAEPASHALSNNPALEQTIHRILNEHMELALTEIKLAIQKNGDAP
jgi:hypothetical protein